MLNKFLNSKLPRHALRESGAGFSLLETVLYLAIVSILLVAVIDFHFTLGGTSAKLSANIETSNNRRTSLNIMEYLIKNADGLLKDVDLLPCSDFTSYPPSLALYFDDDTYLPGTCVSGGGAVRLTVSTALSRLVMKCYPNISNNGEYQACSTVTHPIGNTYYLTSPNVRVYSNSLDFSTSTSSTTDDTFTAITASLSLGTQAKGQTGLTATTSVVSTVVTRNDAYEDTTLIGLWRLEDNPMTSIYNQMDGVSYSCPNLPDSVRGLVNGFGAAADFEANNYDMCFLGDSDDRLFADAFTLAAWVKPETLGVRDEYIFSKIHSNNSLGYALGITAGSYPYCRVCDDASCLNVIGSDKLTSVKTYHLACVYNRLADNVITIYVHTVGTAGYHIDTSASAITLVNYNDDIVHDNARLAIGTSSAASITGGQFDGVLNDLRVYSRALSLSEIIALQSRK